MELDIRVICTALKSHEVPDKAAPEIRRMPPMREKTFICLFIFFTSLMY